MPISFGPDNATLTIHTGVEGRASRFGHRLTITLQDWSAHVEFDGEEADRVQVNVKTAELEVTSGEGGVTPLSDIDRSVIRRTTLKSLKADSHPEATFSSDSVSRQGSQYSLVGTLRVADQPLSCEIAVSVSDSGDSWQVTSHISVRQSDFGIKPYSAILGSLKVSDLVEIELTADVPKHSA